MIGMRSILAVAAALAGGVTVASAQQIPQPTRRPKPPAQQPAAASERMVVYKSPT